MNKEEFLKRLEQLLSDISEEERADALAFYRSYFEDAGIGNEASIFRGTGVTGEGGGSDQERSWGE